MSLEICFDKNINSEIPFFEAQFDNNIDFFKEFSREVTLGLDMTYELAPIELKTYLSIKYNRDKVYNIMLCSPEIIFRIIKFRSGHIYAPYFPMNAHFLEKLNMKVDIDVIVNGNRTHCNTLGAVMKIRKVTRDSPFYSRIRVSEKSIVEKATYTFRRRGVKLLTNRPISYSLTVKHRARLCNVYLIGNTGGVVERIVDFIAKEEMSTNNKKILYFNFDYLTNEFKELNDRCIMFDNNVFDFMFNDENKKLVVLNSVDVLWLKDKCLYDILIEHLLKNKFNRYLIFSRLLSNELSDCFLANIANITINKSYTDIDVVIKSGEEI